jgi:hypothetical protein
MFPDKSVLCYGGDLMPICSNCCTMLIRDGQWLFMGFEKDIFAYDLDSTNERRSCIAKLESPLILKMVVDISVRRSSLQD